MPRTTSGDGAEVFRVVIQRENHTYGPGTEIFGPYGTPGAAKGILTAATRTPWGEPRPFTTGHIERATTTWEKVPA